MSVQATVKATFALLNSKQERIELLESALRFYADESNYVGTNIELDKGIRARKALTGDVSDEAKSMLGK
jgi:hypothetical protein